MIETLPVIEMTEVGLAVGTLAAVGLANPPEPVASGSAAVRAALTDAAWALARLVRLDGAVLVVTAAAVDDAVRQARAQVRSQDETAWPCIPAGDDLTLPVLWGAQWLRDWLAAGGEIHPIVRSCLDAAVRRLVCAGVDLQRAMEGTPYPVRQVRGLDRRVAEISGQLQRIGRHRILDAALRHGRARIELPPMGSRVVSFVSPA